MSIDTGRRIGRYEIQTPLGAGGMGEVYLANDTQLDRPVALKVLSREVAADAERLQRFLREARAASRLKGEHAAHIYDIGEADGLHFIAMEYVEGSTLDKLIDGRPLDVPEVVRTGIHIAEALEEAHSKGITHRDIKPANVILTPRGQAKVLDFGLAKMTNAAAESPDSALATQVQTSPGMVMGTVSYMSPEQALGGRDVDHRTDLYSLGVVLYEMATGRVPFTSDSAARTLDKIIHEPPEAMARFNYAVPPELDVIVKKALRKKREERYQSAHDLLVDLRSLKEELDFAAQQHRSLSPNLSLSPGFRGGESASASDLAGDERATLMLKREPGARTATPQTSPHDAARLTGGGRRRRTFAPLVVASLVAVAGVAAFAFYQFTKRNSPAGGAPFAPLSSMKLAKVPASGATVTAVISPDGKYAARVVWEMGRQSLRLRQLGTTSERDLVPPDRNVSFRGTTPAFSRDGSYVYYVAGKRGHPFSELFRVSLLGGAPQKLVYDVDSGVTLSPDGKRLAFRRHMPKTTEDLLVVANEDGTGEQTIASYKLPQTIDNPAWSPDGRTIAYTVSGTDKDGYYANIEAVGVEDKTVRSVSNARWRALGSLAWLNDSTGLITNARARASLPSVPTQIWYVAFPSGEAQRITNDLNHYVGVSLTADSRTLLAKQGRDTTNIWVAPAGDSARAAQLTSSGFNGGSAISWLPDGRVVYDSDASGNADVWVMNPDGTGARQLTFDPNSDTGAAASPDGRYIVFRSNRAVGWGIWRTDADGSNAKELVSNVDQNQTMGLQFSPDSRWVYYISRFETGRAAVWRVSIDGGEPVKLLSEKVGYVRLSPDGKWFFSTYQAPEPNAPFKIYVFPSEGGEAARELDAPAEMLDARDWSPDGQAIDYVITGDGDSNLWRFPLSGGKPRQLTDWKSDYIYRFSWSPGGKYLAVSRGSAATDLVLIKDFR